MLTWEPLIDLLRKRQAATEALINSLTQDQTITNAIRDYAANLPKDTQSGGSRRSQAMKNAWVKRKKQVEDQP